MDKYKKAFKFFDMNGKPVIVEVNKKYHYILIGSGKKVHRAMFTRFTDKLAFIKKAGNLGITPLLKSEVTIVE